jgi:hypothetical protein
MKTRLETPDFRDFPAGGFDEETQEYFDYPFSGIDTKEAEVKYYEFCTWLREWYDKQPKPTPCQTESAGRP